MDNVRVFDLTCRRLFKTKLDSFTITDDFNGDQATSIPFCNIERQIVNIVYVAVLVFIGCVVCAADTRACDRVAYDGLIAIFYLDFVELSIEFCDKVISGIVAIRYGYLYTTLDEFI